MDSSPSSSASSKYASLRPSLLRARSSSVALKPLALAQLSTTRPRSNSGAANAGSSSSGQHQGDEIGMGVTYTLVPPSPPNEEADLASLASLKEEISYPLPAPVVLAIDRPSKVYAAALGAMTNTRTALGKLLTHKRQRSTPPAKLSSRPAPIPVPTSIPLDVLTPPPSPPPILLDSSSLPLPASASPTTSTFTILPRPLTRARITSVVLLLGSTFLLSTGILLGSLYSLPIHLAHFPTTLAELHSLGSQLRTYAETTSAPGQLWSGQMHVLTVLAYALLWFNAWSIPGSIILNVLVGVLLPPISATLYLTTLTTLGSMLATALTLPAVPLLPSFSLSSPTSLASTLSRPSPSSQTQPPAQSALLSLPHLTPNALVLLRLSGVAPWSLLNIYSALYRTPFPTILWTCLVGCAPWSAVTAQVGSLLAELGAGGLGASSVGEVLRRPSVIGKLVILSLVGGAPVLMKSWVKGRLNTSSSSSSSSDSGEELSTTPRGWLSWSVPSWNLSWVWPQSWAYKRVPTQESEER